MPTNETDSLDARIHSNIKAFLNEADDKAMETFYKTTVFDDGIETSNYLLSILLTGKSVEEVAAFLNTGLPAAKAIMSHFLEPWKLNKAS